jgi:hypothetical protein
MSCKPIQLSIPLPCREDWDQMSPDGRGRFCASCQKTVIDFSNWTDTALYEFFSKNTGPVCGRFQNTQLNRNIKIPPQPKSRLYRLVIACGLTLIFAQIPEAHAGVKAQTEYFSETEISEDISTGDSTNSLKIITRDEVAEPMVGAIAYLSKNGKRVRSGVTGIDGELTLSTIDTGRYELIVTYTGYSGKRIKDIVVTESTSSVINIDFKNSNVTIGIIIHHVELSDRASRSIVDGEFLKNFAGGR